MMAVGLVKRYSFYLGAWGSESPRQRIGCSLHIAVAVGGGVDYLLTWNFKHLANAAMRRGIDRFCLSRGFEPCIICTPEELLEE